MVRHPSPRVRRRPCIAEARRERPCAGIIWIPAHPARYAVGLPHHSISWKRHERTVVRQVRVSGTRHTLGPVAVVVIRIRVLVRSALIVPAIERKTLDALGHDHSSRICGIDGHSIVLLESCDLAVVLEFRFSAQYCDLRLIANHHEANLRIVTDDNRTTGGYDSIDVVLV